MNDYFFSEKFVDFEHFSSVVKEWDLDFLQIGKGQLEAYLQQSIGSEYAMGHCRLNRTFDQRGAAPQDKWTFAVFSQKTPPVIWRKKELPNNSIVLYRPGSEIDCVSKPGFEVTTLSYSEELLNNISRKLSLPGIAGLEKKSDSFVFNAKELSEIRSKLTLLHKTLQFGNLKYNKAVTKYLANDLPEKILTILDSSNPANVSSRKNRVKAINKVKEYLAENSNEPLHMSTLCEITKVSERTLQYAFKEYFGVSPKFYLKSLRLYSVRNWLLRSDPATTSVIEIATNWGFWHMGQFAADYRKLFGELPSETLQKSK